MLVDASVTIRRASIEDAALLGKLGKKTFSEAFKSLTSEADLAAHLAETFSFKQLSLELTDTDSTFLIASIRSEPVGYTKLQAGQAPDCVSTKPVIELVRLYTLKKWWGRGVGAALMENCLDVARQKGYTAIWLSSWKLNDRANAFYRK